MKKRISQKTVATLGFVALIGIPATAQADNDFDNWARGAEAWQKPQTTLEKVTDRDKWDVRVGLGVGVSPKYEGSDDMEVGPMPMIDIEWNDTIYLNPFDGLGAKLYQGRDFTVSGGVGFDPGRQESDSSDLRGLGDVDGAATVNLNFEYELGPITPYVSVEQALGGSDGLGATVGVEAMVPVALLTGRMDMNDMKDMDDGPNGPALSFGLSADWVDDNYMESYFGVNAAQSGRSGLAQHTAEAGFKSVNAEIGVMYPINKQWAVNGQVGYSRLLGDAADSPIVKEEGQISGGVFVAYSF